MVLLGRILLIIGLGMTLVSFIGGFWFMFQDDDAIAKTLLMIVPIGIIVLVAGLSTIVLFSPRNEN